jgi:glycosyltransferase involved in cell wall biosynthesis
MTATPDQLHVLQLGMGWFPECSGGLDRYFYELCPALAALDVRNTGLVAGSENVQRDSAGSVRAFAPVASSLLRRWGSVRRAVRSIQQGTDRPDLVATHFALYAYPVLHLIRGVPLVIHFHGPWAAETRAEGAGGLASALKARVERAVYARGRQFIVLSNAFADILCRDYGVDRDLVQVIPGGVNIARFNAAMTRQEARRVLDWPQDRPIVLAVRRLARRMGLENLIQAAQLVRAKHPDALFLIAGQGKIADDLTAQISSLGLQDHVKLLGFMPDDKLSTAYRAADISVVPSIALEGFGLITAECLASGTPCLVTPVGGLPEVVAPLDPNLVLPGLEPPILAEGICGALSGAVGLPSAEACRAYAEDRFDWAAIAAQVRHVYQLALR